jgi:hypothetical protein
MPGGVGGVRASLASTRFYERRRVRLPPATHLLLGFAEPRSEAEEIKRCLAQFLHEELALELSETKTLITHARTTDGDLVAEEPRRADSG